MTEKHDEQGGSYPNVTQLQLECTGCGSTNLVRTETKDMPEGILFLGYCSKCGKDLEFAFPVEQGPNHQYEELGSSVWWSIE